jgi:subtilase family serine protease
MNTSRILLFLLLPAVLGALLVAIPQAQAASVRPLVTRPVDERRTVELAGNTRPEVTPANDRGRVADQTPLDHMQLLLRRPAETEAALVQLIDRLHDPASPDFHHWLSSAKLRERFGPAPADVAAVSAWLSGHGFAINGVRAAGMVIDFSGKAGQVQEAFQTEIHRLDVRGAVHMANTDNPRIPEALAGVVHGVVSLHDFRPRPHLKPRPAYSLGAGQGNAVVPADLWTVYNFFPLLSAGISGAGQTVVVIEDSDVHDPADVATFRSVFGLSAYKTGSFTQVHPAPATGSNNCKAPGVVAPDESEATLDAEWASAGAPGATIELASCANSATTDGLLVAIQNVLDSPHPPGILSLSYGSCEAENGVASNAAYNAAYQQGVAQGASIFVSAGDQLAGSCESATSYTTTPTAVSTGIGVSALASTPYNVAVGGTDFADTYQNSAATYWGTANSAVYGSALSYVPEIPWNDSCASVLLASYNGYGTTYGAGGYCNSSQVAQQTQNAGGSGGPSGCATGSPASAGVVGGSCQGWPKPSWQTVSGNPADGVRDLPDVSLFAADGAWNEFYVYCDSDTSDQGAVCVGQEPRYWSGGGGTSFAAPILAGIQALVNQARGAFQGNPNPVYYGLARAEYGATGASACNASLGNGVASDCVFQDVTLGDIDAPCTGATDCYLPGGATGVLSLTSSADQIAYPATAGWDFATGIGSINVANLVNHWTVSTQALTVSSPSLSFPAVAVGSRSAAELISLQSTGTSTVTLTSIGITGTGAASFLISANSCGSSLAAGASCAVSVEFAPATAGIASASLTIADSTVASPEVVTLAGASEGSLPSYSGGQLTLPALAIGGATYSNVGVSVGSILSGPSGTSANSVADVYDPATGQMTVPAVQVGTRIVYNVVITVRALTGIGSVANADVYDGTYLSIPSVQVVGGATYRKVVITPGQILNVGGGMPALAQDSYDPATGTLTIAAVQVGSRVYTNVIVTVGKIVSVG